MTVTPYSQVAPGFVQAMGMTLLRGRGFNAQDKDGSPMVAIINEEMAAQFWPGQDPWANGALSAARRHSRSWAWSVTGGT